MSNRLVQATFGIYESDLPRLALSAYDLPSRYQSYTQTREEALDNYTMAVTGFPGATEERFRAIGRIGGFVREFWSSTVDTDVDGADVLVGSVAHLFDNPDGVHAWMHDVFLHDFQNNIGSDAGEDQILVGADRFTPEGFYDEAVGLRASYNTSGHPVTATIIDFRVGRILGVAYHSDYRGPRPRGRGDRPRLEIGGVDRRGCAGGLNPTWWRLHQFSVHRHLERGHPARIRSS